MRNTFSIKSKTIALLILFCNFITAYSVDANLKYYLFHSSGMVVSATSGSPKLANFDAGLAQTFQFVQSGSYYLIKNQSTGRNIAKTGTWDTEFSTSTGNVAKFTIESCGGEYIKLKCADNNLYLGTDATDNGSSLYSDKNGKETLHFWYLREASNNEIITDGLENAIERAKQKLSQTKEGNKEGEFSTKERNNLQMAISEAQSVLQTPISQSDVIEATQILTSATNDYLSKRNLPFVVGEKYYIMHASNRFLANVNNSVQIKNRDNSTAQQFVFEEASNGTYSIKNVQSGTYLTSSGEYSVAFMQAPNSSTARFKIAYAPNEDLYIRFQVAEDNQFIGTDGTSDGKGVYSDKNGNDGKHYWHLIRVDASSEQPYTNFRNGSSALRLGMNWYDEDGKHINVHGGCVLYKDGTYYWFGENYRPSPVKSNGIGCYTSKDMYNWKFECMAWECPEEPLRNDYQDMNYGRTLERPKVMYCPNTGKYVMWVHWENGSGYAASRVAILWADKITGPYNFVKTQRPRGDEQPSGSRDQTLMFDPDYNVAYHFGSAEENMTMHGTLLRDDYLELTNTWERIFVKKQYEAPAIFKYHKRFVAISSGCTGWDPNPAHSSYSQMPLSGWEDSGNPCVDANNKTTYCSQSNFVFKVPNKYDAYIYMGDRWKGGDYFNDANVGESWHIWLPIDMRTGYPIIRFYSEWDLSLFDKLNRYRRVENFEEGKEYLLLSKNANKILSLKDEKLLLAEDDENINLSFKITTADGYYVLTDLASGKVLDGTDGKLTLADSVGGYAQQWKIVSSNTSDGYYYFYPRSNENKAITNYSASPTSNGIVGLNNAEKLPACQFAFCFDSEKHDYQPISDESDGSYQKWIEAKGYKQVETETTTCDKIKSNDSPLRIYNVKGGITIHSDISQAISLTDVQGKVLHHFSLRGGNTETISLEAGVYIVNGRKFIVEP